MVSGITLQSCNAVNKGLYMGALILNENQVEVAKTSFTQDEAHQTKSAKFVPIQPSQLAAVLADHGFDLVHLKMGRARIADRAAHQTTIARYRAKNALSIKSGGRDLYMDLVLKVPHIYGALQAYVGTYRQICTNGLVVGHKFVSGRVAHVGDAMSQLDKLLPSLISQHDQLVDHIRLMQSRNVTPNEIAQLTKQVADLRLDGIKNVVSVQYSDLAKVRRAEDTGTDLFTVMNVLQENVMRNGFRYQTETTQLDTRTGMHYTVPRNNTARPVTRTKSGDTETVRSVDLNASIWDAAMNILSQKEAA